MRYLLFRLLQGVSPHRRADGVFLHAILDDIIGHLLRAVFAFNGRFFPGTRWLAEELAALPAKPDRLYDRLLAILLTAPQLERPRPAAIEVGVLVAYERPLPDLAAYDGLLEVAG